MSRFMEIQTALDARLESFTTDASIAWPNVQFEPSEGSPWIRPSNLPNDPVAIGLRDDDNVRTQGFYQIDIFTPANEGPGSALSLADQIANHFRKGLQITSGNSAVKLGVPGQQPASPSGAWFRVAVLIPYNVISST